MEEENKSAGMAEAAAPPDTAANAAQTDAPAPAAENTAESEGNAAQTDAPAPAAENTAAQTPPATELGAPENREELQALAEDAPLKPVEPPKRKRRWIWNIVLIAVIALGIYSMFGISGEISTEGISFVEAMRRIDWVGAVILIAVILVLMALDCCKFFAVNKAVLGRVRPIVAIKTNFLGKFYDGITPFSTGGQPMQIYYMTTKHIGGAASSAVVLIRYFGSTFAFTIVGAAFMIAGQAMGVLAGVSGNLLLIIMGWVGLVVNFLPPLFILSFVLFPRLARRLTGWFIYVGYKLKIVKSKERTMRKALRTVRDFISCFRIIARKPLCLILFLLFCFAEVTLSFMVPYFVMNMFSVKLDGMFFIVTALNVFAVIGSSFIPTPGNSGVIEGMGILAFSVAAGEVLAWSVLFWRFSVYYIYILIGTILTIIDLFRKNLGKRRAAKSLTPPQTGAAPQEPPAQDGAQKTE